MTTSPGPGLRERKKQRTRDALLRAALELFTTRGFERTTIDEIAAAVDVSQRTFFRYFPNKEEVVFAVQEMSEARFLAALRERPGDEDPLTALRRAILLTWDTIGDGVETAVPLSLHMRTYRMIESTPSLLAGHLRRFGGMEEKIARVIAEREGLDVETDPRPRVVVAAFGGVMRVTGQLWAAGGDDGVQAIRDLTAHHLDVLAPALAADWRAPVAEPGTEPDAGPGTGSVTGPDARVDAGPGGEPSGEPSGKAVQGPVQEPVRECAQGPAREPVEEPAQGPVRRAGRS